MSDPRDEFLKTLDFNMLEVREYPRIAFLCGGNPEVFSTQDDGKVTSATPWARISLFFSRKLDIQRQHFPSVRSYLSQLLSIKHPNLRFQNAEDIKDWNSYSAYDDLIEFEKDIAHLCKAIVLFVESPGSIAELGTFSVIPEISKKLVVFVHSDFSHSPSFVSLGPLKKIDDAVKDRVHYITWGLDKRNIQGRMIDVVNQESLAEWGDYTCNAIKDAIEKTHPVSHTSEEFRRTKEALFIHDVVCLFKAVDEVEILKYLKQANHEVHKKDVQRSIFCLEKLELIRPIKRGSKTFYVPDNNPSLTRYLSLPAGLDTARLAVQLSEYYKHPSHLARREAIREVLGGRP